MSNRKQFEGSKSMSPCFSHAWGKSDSRSSCHRDLSTAIDLTADSMSPLDLHTLCFFCSLTELKWNSISLKTWRRFECEEKILMNCWLTGTATWSSLCFCAIYVSSISPHCFNCFLQQPLTEHYITPSLWYLITHKTIEDRLTNCLFVVPGEDGFTASASVSIPLPPQRLTSMHCHGGRTTSQPSVAVVMVSN